MGAQGGTLVQRAGAVLCALVLWAVVSTEGRRTSYELAVEKQRENDEILRRALLAAPSSPDLCPHQQPGSIVQDPPILRSSNGRLDVEFYFRTSVGDNDYPRFCYITPDGQQSPTLYLRIGDTLRVTLHNDVTANVNITDAGFQGRLPRNFSVCQQSADTLNLGSTNFHFHGMEVTPTCGGDQVIHVAINPGETYTYTAQITDAVTPGNYYYHPHLTGDTEYAIQGGATGAIIIAGLETQQPAVAGLFERVFLMRDFNLAAAVANDTNAPAWDISINYIPIRFAQGYPPAIIQMKSGETQVWSITNSAADTIMEFQIVYDGVAQPLRIISRDGAVLRRSSGGQLRATILNDTGVLIGTAARVQLLVSAPPSSVRNASFATAYVDTGPDGDFDPFRVIANIVINNSRPDPALQYPAASPGAAPAPLPQLSSAVRRNRTLYFSEVLQDPSNPNSPTTFYLTETGDIPTAFVTYEPIPITVEQGSVEEWIIENRAMETHVFHIHQLHFTVLEAYNIGTLNVNPGTPYIVGQFVETIVIPYWNGTGPYPAYRVLMDFTRVDVGEFVVHCHMAEHEDQGMTTPVQVVRSS